MDKKTKNRSTVKLKSPNPLFEKWLTEWKDKARENGSKMEHTFNIALKNLKKFPIPLKSGRDCMMLKGFGPKLCEMLDNKLKKHKANDIDATILVEEPLLQEMKKRSKKTPKKAQSEGVLQPIPKNIVKKKTPKKTKLYTPAYASGPYAIIITLLNHSQKPNYSGCSTKEEIINDARAICNKSFTKPEPGSFYTAWSSMSNLVSKNLVEKKGKPIKYCLTSEGEEVALRLIQSQENAQLNVMFGNNKDPPDNIMDTENIHEMETNTCSINSQIRTVSSNLVSSNSQNSESVTCSQNSYTSKQNSTVVKSTERSQENMTYGCSQNLNIEFISNTQNSTSSTVVRSAQNSQKTNSNSQASTEQSCSSQVSNFEQIIFAPGSFDTILIVDTHETEGSNKGPIDDDTKYELNQLGILYEIRHMKVGDFTWICRDRQTESELVLPYVAERKRMDDLGHSIKDGRFHEQKFRLKQSGIQNLMYIIESFGSNTHTGLPLSSLMQAASNTLVQDGFQVKFTESHRHSMQYVAGFSLMLKKYYENKTLISCPKEDLQKHTVSDDLISLLTFKDFNKAGAKSKDHTVKELFVKHLVQLKGMSVDKALAIVEKYPTPRRLIQEYEKIGGKGENLLTKIEFGPLKRTVGPVLSKSVYQLYTSDKLM